MPILADLVMVDEYKVTFLGTVGGMEAVGSQLGGSGGIVLDFEGTTLHIDPGPGSLLQARRAGINVRATNVLLVSSNQLHSCNDVNMLIDSMTYSGLDSTGLLLCSRSVVERTEQERPYITRAHKKMIQRYKALVPNEEVKINNMKVIALPARNADETSVGFKIVTKKFTLVYTGDTTYYEGLHDVYKGADVLIVNNRFPFRTEREPQAALSSDDTLKLIDAVKPKVVLLTGFGRRLLEKNPLYEAREMQNMTGVHVVAAREGMSVSPLTMLGNVKVKNTF